MIRKCICLCAVLLVGLFLLSACGSQTQDAEATESDGAYTAVKDDDGNITGYERKYHNDNGDITRWDVYDADEQYDHYILYEYDSSNRLVKETCYQADGIGMYYYAYSYTEDGVIAEKDYVTAKEGSERILYDADGKEQYRFTYDIDDNMTKCEMYRDGAWEEAQPPTRAPEEGSYE